MTLRKDQDVLLKSKVLRAARNRVHRNRDFSVNAHHLCHQAEKFAREIGTTTETVLAIMEVIYGEALGEAFKAAKTAQGTGGH